MLRLFSGLLILLVTVVACAEPEFKAPPGFTVEQIAAVPNARALAWGDEGTLFVSTQFKSAVYAVTDVLGDPVVRQVGPKLRIPNGIAFFAGNLYVAEPTRLLVFRDIEQNLDDAGEPEVLVDDLPADKQHSWKYIAFGPDGKLYVTVGAPCNVCNEPGYALILRMNADGTEREVYAQGIRNSVGLAWHPVTNELWFTDNNRDMMGDDLPPGELNRASVQGLNFGFPFCHGADIPEPEPDLAALGDCADSTPPAMELGAHVAALGLTFYDGIMFPATYRNQVFIAEHGSWNRSEKIGYRITLVTLADDGRSAVSYEPFVTGWLDGDTVLGRPADVIVAPDGSLLVSDDKAGAIFRISYAN